jgi:hypothetical protein
MSIYVSENAIIYLLVDLWFLVRLLASYINCLHEFYED